MTFRSSVRTRRSNPMHACGWPGCQRPVPLELWGCSRHWYTLPAEIRDALWQGYTRGKFSPEWIAANDAALAWIQELPARFAARNVGKDTPVPGQGGDDVDSDATSR